MNGEKDEEVQSNDDDDGNDSSSSSSDYGDDSSDGGSDDAFCFRTQKFGGGDNNRGGTRTISTIRNKLKRNVPATKSNSNSKTSNPKKDNKGHPDDSNNDDEGDDDEDDDDLDVSVDDDDMAQKLAFLAQQRIQKQNNKNSHNHKRNFNNGTNNSQGNSRKKQKQRGDNSIDLLDSDDDSDCGGIFASQAKTMSATTAAAAAAVSTNKYTGSANNTCTTSNNKYGSATGTATATNVGAGAGKTKSKSAISILDSDSDDDIDDAKLFSPTTKAALDKARMAKEALERATNTVVTNFPFEILDDNVSGDESMDVDACWESSAKKTTAAATETATPATTQEQVLVQPTTGPFIQIKLRTNVKSAPKNFNPQHLQNNTVDQVRFRTGTILPKVLEKYHSLHPITKFSTVKFMFDGEVMNVSTNSTTTLASYDMDDDDLVDVIVEIPNDAESKMNQDEQQQKDAVINNNTQCNRNGNTFQYMKINTRIKDGDPEKTHTYQLKAADPFEKLLKAYRDQHGYSSFTPVFLEYNNKRINGEESPSDLGMMDGCLVDICDEVERTKQINRMSKSSTSSGIGGTITAGSQDAVPKGGISLKVRINGEDKSIKSYGIALSAPFQTLMQKFCEFNKVTEKDCKFQFDGQVLNPKGTPEDEDLEGDEMIEVKIDEKVLEEAKSKISLAVPVNDAIAVDTGAIKSVPQPSTTINRLNHSQTIESFIPYPATDKIISVLTLRNNIKHSKSKKFKVRDSCALSVMQAGYLKCYRDKGCSSVIFYHKNMPINDTRKTFASLGVKDMDVLVAMENGKDYDAEE